MSVGSAAKGAEQQIHVPLVCNVAGAVWLYSAMTVEMNRSIAQSQKK